MRQSIALTALLVDEYDRAIDYFIQTLGFTLAEDRALSETKRWVVVRPPGSTEGGLLLARADDERQREAIGNQSGGRVFLFLQTDDFDRDCATFKARGVKFLEEPRREDYGSVAVFEDLYGNRWDLIQPDRYPTHQGDYPIFQVDASRPIQQGDHPNMQVEMLDWLIAPRLQRLLSALLLHPEQDYSFNDLVRIANVGNRGGQMAIDSLAAAGLFTEQRSGNQRRFRINTGYPIYEELRAICVKTFGIALPIKEALSKFDQIEMAFIFGSVARGKDRGSSDVDVMAIGAADPFAWNDCAFALEQELGRPVHFSLYDEAEWKRLLSSDPVIQSIDKGPKLMVIDNGRPT